MGVLRRIEIRKKQKIKKALRSYQGRFWKNLAIFLAGVLCSGFFVAGASVLVLKFVPLSKVTGDKTDKIVSSELANKSLLDVLVNAKNYTVDDLVIVNTLIDSMQNLSVGGKKLSDFIHIDTNKLSGVRVVEIATALKDAISVTATLYNTIGSDKLNDLGIGGISALNDYLPVMLEDSEGNETTTQATVGAIDTTASGFKAKLYYYKDAENTYKRAYNNDNSLVEGVTIETKLYYAALVHVPVTDAVTLIGDTLGRVQATELLSVIGFGGEDGDEIIQTLLEGKTIKDLATLSFEDIMVGDLLKVDEDDLLYKILTDALGDWDTISIDAIKNITNEQINNVKVSTFLSEPDEMLEDIFTQVTGADSWEDVTVGALSNMGENAFNSIKLSLFLGEDNETLELLHKAMTGADKPASANDITLGHLKGGFSINNLPLAEVLQGLKPTEYDEDGNVVVKGDMLADVLVQVTGDEWSEITINSLSGLSDKAFNSIKLSLFLGEDNETLDLLYKAIAESSRPASANDITLGHLQGGFSINNLSLSEVLKDLKPTEYDEDGNVVAKGDLLADVLVQATNLPWDQISVDALSGKDSYGKPIFDINRVKLSLVLTNPGALKDILVDIVPGDKSFEDITINDLNGGLSIDNLHLSSVMTGLKQTTYKANGEIDVKGDMLVDVLVQATNSSSWEAVTISMLSGKDNNGKPIFDINKVKLSLVLTNPGVLEKILVDIVPGDKSFEDITINDLNGGLSIDNLHLSSVMTGLKQTTYKANGEIDVKGDMLVDVLVQATNSSSWDEVTISMLSGKDNNGNPIFDINKVKLSLVLTNPGVLKDILVDIVPGEKNFEDLTIKDLNGGLSIDNLRLSSVMKGLKQTTYKANGDIDVKGDVLADVLAQATGNSWADIKVSDLSGDLTFDNVELKTVMGGEIDGAMDSVLRQAFNVPAGEKLTVSTLSGTFTPGNIKVSTLNISTNGNSILEKVFADENLTVGQIGEKFSSLTLYELYGEECFKPIDTEGATFVDTTTLFAREEIDTDGDGVNDSVAFVHEDESYFNTNPTAVRYGLCANDGMWLLLCFDFGNVDARWEDTIMGRVKVGSGRPEEYIISNLTLNDLTKASIITSKFESATIAQLVDAGLLSISEKSKIELIKAYTLVEALDNLIQVPSIG